MGIHEADEDEEEDEEEEEADGDDEVPRRAAAGLGARKQSPAPSLMSSSRLGCQGCQIPHSQRRHGWRSISSIYGIQSH